MKNDEHRRSKAEVRVGDCVAVPTYDGACPIGLVVRVDADEVELDFYSFITGDFGFVRRTVRWVDVFQVVHAERDGDVFDTYPLGAYQRVWIERAELREGRTA